MKLMKQWQISGLLMTGILLGAAISCTRSINLPVTPNPTATGTPTVPAPTSTSTGTSTPTKTVTATATSTSAGTATNTPTTTPTGTPTNSPTITATATPTGTPTDTGTPTYTGTPTNTGVNTATNTVTNTATATATDTPLVNVDFDNWQDGGSNPSNDGKTFIKCGGGSNTGTLASAWLLGPPYIAGTSCLSAAVTNTYHLPGRTNSLACTITFDASSNVVELAPAPWSTAPSTGTVDATNGSGNPALTPSYVSFWIYANAPVTLANVILVTGSWGSGPGVCDSTYTTDETEYANYNFVPPIGVWTNVTIPINGNASWVDKMTTDSACAGPPPPNTLDWTQVSSIVTDFTGAPSSNVTVALADYYFYP